jgi:hypothetical protein
VEQRAQETGLFLALGLPKKMIGRFIYFEHGLLIFIGSILGGLLGILYNQLILEALKTIWSEAVGTSALEMKIELSSVLSGLAAGMILAFMTVGLVVRIQTRRTVTQLLSSAGLPLLKSKKNRSLPGLIVAWTSLLAAAGLIIYSGPGKDAAGAFFAAGALLLTSGLSFTYLYFTDIKRRPSADRLNLIKIAIRSATRNVIRGLMLIGLMASGLFILFTVGANRHGKVLDPHLRTSGTGGFTICAESVIPVLYDLKSEKGRTVYNLEESLFDRVDYVPFRLREGDDASCLNLNRVSNPHLLGVDPALLHMRKSFTFSARIPELADGDPWIALNAGSGETVIPGIADETVIIWGLGKSVGDTLTYTDEYGKPFHIKLIAGLANSVFQGNIIISGQVFSKKYPSISGYRFFLIETPGDKTDLVSERLSWAMQDLGFQAILASEWLMAFNAVENTYLSIFLILGGFGLILGTIGIGIVVLRTTIERRSELALLRSIGFTRRSVSSLLAGEHLFLLAIGAVCGAGASLTALLPVWLAAGASVPYLSLIIILLLVTGSGVMWTVLATRIAMSQDLISALQVE